MFKFPVYVLMCVTAYTASYDECGKEDGLTASGRPARANFTVAIDKYTYGTKIRLLDGTTFVVEDRIGDGNIRHMDIFMETKEEAWEFGRQWRFVEIIEDDKNERKGYWNLPRW